MDRTTVPAYPPSEWTTEGLATALGSNQTFPLPKRSDRDRWSTLTDDDLIAHCTERLIEFAEDALSEPIPDRRAHTIRDYAAGSDEARTTNLNQRTTFQMRLMAFSLAECVEAEGRFLDSILDYAWDWCEQTIWTNPSNLGEYSDAERLGHLPRFTAKPTERMIDLRSRNGLELAELAYCLGEALPPGLSDRIRVEVERRLIEPYEATDDFWWHQPPTNNWNAVCNASCAGAALYLIEDPDRLAHIVKRAVDSLEHFLAGFDKDGGTPEGVGYWNFGFGYFTQFASLLESRTGGAYSLYNVPIVRDIARFPLNVQLSIGRYPAFSDSMERAYVNPYLPCWAGNRLDDPELRALGRWALRDGRARDTELWRNEHFGITARNLLWAHGVDGDAYPQPPKRTFLDGLGWWIVRQDPGDPEAPVVAAKGGHNAEPHNHNDCGSFIYHYQGDSLLTDLGSPKYCPGYFDDETRYQFLAARSLGHSVPLVGDTEQTTPDDTDSATPSGARIRDHSAGDPDELTLELAECYPSSMGLDSLIRQFSFTRSPTDTHPAGQLTVRDRASFDASAPSPTLESLLISYQPMEIQNGGIIVGSDQAGVRVEPSPSASLTVEELPEAMTASTPDRYWDGEVRDVWRARIGPVRADEDPAELSVTITPRGVRH